MCVIVVTFAINGSIEGEIEGLAFSLRMVANYGPAAVVFDEDGEMAMSSHEKIGAQEAKTSLGDHNGEQIQVGDC